MWWTIGALFFGIGTLTESINTLVGWSLWNMKAWYISGALLGAFPLAQGTVYLLLKKKFADITARFFIFYILAASVAITFAPVDMSLVDPARLTGKVMMWSWVRLFSILPNTYALIFRNCSREIWLKQERQDGRAHQLHQFLKGVLAVAFCRVQDSG